MLFHRNICRFPSIEDLPTNKTSGCVGFSGVATEIESRFSHLELGVQLVSGTQASLLTLWILHDSLALKGQLVVKLWRRWSCIRYNFFASSISSSLHTSDLTLVSIFICINFILFFFNKNILLIFCYRRSCCCWIVCVWKKRRLTVLSQSEVSNLHFELLEGRPLVEG